MEHHYRELLAGNPPPKRSALTEVFWSHWQRIPETQIGFAKGDDMAAIGRLAERTLLRSCCD